MARRERDNRGASGEATENTTADTANENATTHEGDPNLPPETSAAAQQNGAGVDTGTGEIKGQSQENIPAPEVVHMPKKIVAKEIIPRAKLKGGKKWIPGRNPTTGEVLNDGTGVWELDAPRPLYTVFGTASGTDSGTTSYGEWTSFTGQFEAVRTEDGARFRSNVLILQEPANSLLLQALQDAKTRDKDASLSFAFNVGIRTSQRWVDSNEGNSYEYTIESVINVEKSDPLAGLRHSLAGILPKAQKALPGPTES